MFQEHLFRTLFLLTCKIARNKMSIPVKNTMHKFTTQSFVPVLFTQVTRQIINYSWSDYAGP